MALKITERELDDVAVMEVEGRIVLGEETAALRESVKGLLAAGKKKIVLDLKNVTLIDSSGLGALVAAHSAAKANGALLRLCNLGPHSDELLQITKLYTVFDISPTVEDAFGAMTKAASAG